MVKEGRSFHFLSKTSTGIEKKTYHIDRMFKVTRKAFA
jgi:hypothetical protein